MIQIGDPLPDARLSRIGASGPEHLNLSDICKGGDVALFGLPGAFTRTCSAAHLPSFMRTADDLRGEGVTRIVCVSVNDPFVMKAWDEATGASEAGVELLADGDSTLTRAMGLAFSAPDLGFIDRCMRFSALVREGRLRLFNTESQRGVCDLTAGETLLGQIRELG